MFAKEIEAKVALAPVVATDNTVLTGNTIDNETAAKTTFIVQTGTLADADATFPTKLQHGDLSDASDMADCAAADVDGGLTDLNFTFTNDNATKKLTYIGMKKYSRAVISPTVNTGNAPIAILAILSGQKKQPV